VGVPKCVLVSTAPDFQFANREFIGYLANMTVAENRFLKEAIKQGLRMQDRFLAEPVLARTGKGYMKSEGVATLQRIKANLKKSKSA
jgi:predicted DNA-binding protein